VLRRRIQRPQGMPSSHLLLDAMTGDLDDFGLEAYVGDPSDREVPGADFHSQMEARGRGRAGQPATTRAFF